MRFGKSLACALALGAGFAAAPALAQEESKPLGLSVSGGVWVTTDYVFRGVSQSDDDAAIQGSFSVTHDDTGIFVGIWGSNVDFNDGDETSVEFDIYAGYSNSVGDLTYTVTALYYYYPGANNDLDYDYFEVLFGAEYSLGIFTPSMSFAWSPDYFGSTGDAYYISAGLAADVFEYISLSGDVGYQFSDGIVASFGDQIVDWNIGATFSTFGLDFDVRYYDTDLEENGLADSRFVFTVSTSF